jgi:hypothetical protein
MQREGAWYLMSHVIITLALIMVYAYTIHLGLPDQTLQNILLIMAGYWFGAMGMDKIKGKAVKKIE